jgi:hypothetical protein
VDNQYRFVTKQLYFYTLRRLLFNFFATVGVVNSVAEYKIAVYTLLLLFLGQYFWLHNLDDFIRTEKEDMFTKLELTLVFILYCNFCKYHTG